MKFVILGTDGPEGVQKRPLYRPAHLQWLEAWVQQNKIILAGPLTDQTGSLIVVEADSLEEVRAFAKEDPYTLHGIFQKVTIHPFLQVFPTPIMQQTSG